MQARGSLLLLSALVLICGLLRAGYEPGDTQTPASRVELSFWNGFTGPDGRVMLGIVREFNTANPDVHVTMQRMDWGTYYNKLLVSCADGRGPDVLVSHASTLTRLVMAHCLELADDLYATTAPDARSPDLGSTAPSPGDFDEVVLEQLRFQGHYVGLALDVHPQGLYANLDLLEQGGIDHLPRTGDELVATALKLKRQGTSRDDELWGFSLTMWRNNFFSLVPQFGGRLVDDHGLPTLDLPENIAALERLVRLVRSEQAAPDPENNLGWVGFRQKKIAMVMDGIYMLGDLQRLSGLRYAAVPTPQFGPHPGTHGDSHVLCIRRGVSPRTREAAVRFIRFLSAHSIEWAQAGQVPARRSVRATDAFRAMPVQYQFSLQVPYVRYPPRTPILFELTAEVDVAVERALRGRMTSAEALQEAQANVTRFLRRSREEGSDPFSSTLTPAAEAR